MIPISFIVLLVFTFQHIPDASGFTLNAIHNVACFPSLKRTSLLLASQQNESFDLVSLQADLTAYLEKRKQVNADEAAQQEVGKVIGGTKGNAILDFISGAPNKEKVVEEAPNVFDYDQLERYGYGHLVKSIMAAGGRVAMYELMGMPVPVSSNRPVQLTVSAPPLVIDRRGDNDPGRYSGLKLQQALDDDAIAKALEEAQRKTREGQRLRPKLEEEDYVMPFADKRNVGPKLTPDWTPDRLDEYGKARGKAIAWARRARQGEFVTDPYEMLTIDGSLQIYSYLAILTVAVGLGRSTAPFLELIGMNPDGAAILQAPALALLLAHAGSCLVCAVWLAGERKRNQLVWAFKGLLAGPVAVTQLRGLDPLVTREELQNQNSQAS